uniref:Non-structural protein NS-S n=1 Tax=Daphnia galeata TaxID=27404 RepID=A0A8J2RL35_9CRUS|nr:unnamed protein product [Daphnia galeata]
MLFVSRLTRRGTSVTRLPLLMLNIESPQTLWLTRLSSLPELRLVESNSLTLTLTFKKNRSIVPLSNQLL